MRGRNMKKIGSSEAGQSLVETAVTLPVLFAVMLGCAQLAQVAYASIEVANAAKAAVQYGAQGTGTVIDTPGIKAAALNETTDVLSSLTTNPKISIICSDGSVPSDSTTGPPWSNEDCNTSTIEQVLTVTTQGTFTPFVKIPGYSSYTLHASAVQRVLAY